MTPEEFDKKYKIKTKGLSPEEFDKKHKIKKTGLTPEEFDKRHAGATGYFGPSLVEKLIAYATAKHIIYDPEEVRGFKETTGFDPKTGKRIPRDKIKEPPTTRMPYFEEPTGAALAAAIAGGYTTARAGKATIDVAREAVKKGLSWLTGGVTDIPGAGVKAGVKALSAKQLEKTMAKAAVEKLGREIAEAATEQAAKVSRLSPAIIRIGTAIKEAASKRKEQATLYSLERGKRIGKAMAVKGVKGERRFIIQKGKLKDPLPKVEYESIRSKVSQEDIDGLFDLVHDSPVVKGWDNITAQEGLARLLGAEGGALPTDSQLAMLRKIFPPDFIKTILKKRTAWQKVKKGTAEVLNIPRAFMSSYDLSAPFRQGLMLMSHPKRFFQSFKKMFKLFGSEKTFAALQESIKQKPTYNLMRESKLALTELGQEMGLREEIFMSSWAEKIPILGRGVRASSRAYVGFLNKLRADVFEDLIKKADKLGLNASGNLDLSTEIAKFVNAASGRGNLRGLERSAVMLNATLFSPRLIASRMTFLNPANYVTGSPFVRKQYLKSLLTVTGLTMTTLTMAKAGGLDVGLDPRSADFMKIKVRGKVRIDVLGGFQQYIRAAAQIISGEYISSTTGKLVTLGEGYRPLTREEIAIRFAKSKLSPAASFASALLVGKEPFTDKPISVPKEVGKRFVPMVMQDLYDLATEEPDLLPLGIPAMFGVGLQVYKPRRKKPKGIKGLEGIKGIQGIK